MPKCPNDRMSWSFSELLDQLSISILIILSCSAAEVQPNLNDQVSGINH